jgi:hypothetical protein
MNDGQNMIILSEMILDTLSQVEEMRQPNLYLHVENWAVNDATYNYVIDMLVYNKQIQRIFRDRDVYYKLIKQPV